MPIRPTLELLQAARQGGYAVVGFEPYGPDQIQAIVDAAVAERSPVLLQIWSEVAQTWGMASLAAFVRDAAERVDVPVALHLDHATDDALIDDAIAAGFTSVMFDGSDLPFKDNIRRTSGVVERAHARNVAVEAELGVIGRIDMAGDVERTLAEVHARLTDPEDARQFTRETGADILAPAVGTIHGCRVRDARLDCERIREIAAATGVPLALHGGSSAGPEALTAAIAAGVAKVNIDTEVRDAAIAALRCSVNAIGTTHEPDYVEFARYPRAVKLATTEAARARIRLVGSSGRAASH